MSFSLTRKTDYALVALSRLAVDSAEASPVSARHIADLYDLPLPIMMNVLKDLASAGLVTSKRGASGGYYLSRPHGQISFAQVIEAIEGPVTVTACCEDTSEDESEEPCLACRLEQSCPITGAMKQFNDLVVAFLYSMTLEDMMRNDLSMSMVIRNSDASDDRTIHSQQDTQPVALNNAIGQTSGNTP